MCEHDFTKVITDQSTNTIIALLQCGQEQIKETVFDAAKCPIFLQSWKEL